MALRQYRDLVWCIQTPGLVRPSDIYPDDQWFHQLALPSAINDHFPEPKHPHRFRLGLQFERIWQFWFANNASEKSAHKEGTRLLSANLQVREPHHTIGEFDFIVDHLGTIEHWEVAVKFYLGCHDTADIEHWYGPNTSDRLALKLDRLHNHQLKLGEFPEARALLQQNALTIDRVRGLVKGRLFYPWVQFATNQFEVAPELNPSHLKGWWMDLAAFEAHQWPNPQFVLLTKQWWLSPIVAGDCAPTIDQTALLEFLQGDHAEQATHIAVVDPFGNEQHRGFVVNEQWLNKVGL